MSVMSDMLADVLKKSVPPEVFAMLTPENMQAFKNNAEQLVTELRQGIANCQAQNMEALQKIDRLLQLTGEIHERRDDSAGARPATRKRGSGSAADSGTGDE